MAASFLCEDCLPEGSSLACASFGDLFKTGPPRHCQGRNDRILRGVIGGYRCSCKCNQGSRFTWTSSAGAA